MGCAWPSLPPRPHQGHSHRGTPWTLNRGACPFLTYPFPDCPLPHGLWGSISRCLVPLHKTPRVRVPIYISAHVTHIHTHTVHTCRYHHADKCHFSSVSLFLTEGTDRATVTMHRSVVKNPPANAGDAVSIPGLGRSPGEGNGNPLQYSCLGNPMDRGAWRATVHGVANSRT